jgi:hypothetical protein
MFFIKYGRGATSIRPFDKTDSTRIAFRTLVRNGYQLSLWRIVGSKPRPAIGVYPVERITARVVGELVDAIHYKATRSKELYFCDDCEAQDLEVLKLGVHDIEDEAIIKRRNWVEEPARCGICGNYNDAWREAEEGWGIPN